MPIAEADVTPEMPITLARPDPSAADPTALVGQHATLVGLYAGQNLCRILVDGASETQTYPLDALEPR